jgi:hypothetical protein
MPTIQITAPVTNADEVRTAFGQAAYSGLLPRAQWTTAQRLVGDYDDATDDAARAAIASRMLAMADGDDGAETAVRIAA